MMFSHWQKQTQERIRFKKIMEYLHRNKIKRALVAWQQVAMIRKQEKICYEYVFAKYRKRALIEVIF